MDYNFDKDILYQVMTEGIWYYNKLGEVGHNTNVKVDTNYINFKVFGRNMGFNWKDLNIKFFLTKNEAEKAAKEYLDYLLKYVDISALKKIVNLKENDEIVELSSSKHLFHRTVEQYSYWDKKRKTFIIVSEYDDDYGGGYDEFEYPIHEYGHSWFLTEKDAKEHIYNS